MSADPSSRLVGSWSLTSTDELSGARRYLEESLKGQPATIAGVEPELAHISDVILVASELVANALKHTGGPARLDLLCDDISTVISVMDQEPGKPPVLAPDRELGQGGFGLQLAMRIADDVGWYTTPDGEKYVWARFTARAADEMVTPRR